MTEHGFKAACVQLRTGQDMQANIADAVSLIRKAAGEGADYVLTPEQTSLMELKPKALFSQVRTEDNDLALPAFRALAAELGVWLHIGSLAIRLSDDKAANRSFLIAPDGTIAARYDKVHMFDVDLAGGESYRESQTYQAGDEAVVAELPWGKLGLSICYDLRFPHLYRTLSHAGAHFLTVPAAFTRQTGQAHWHTLLRARAIENGAFVLAAAQGGMHENGRETYGHSLIISPWGDVLAEAYTDPGVIIAEIDVSAVEHARGRIPSLSHDRSFALVKAEAPEARSAS